MNVKISFNYFICLLAIILMTESANAQNWQLVWQDEFTNGISSDWNFEVNGNGGGNNELQYYRQENASVQNGKLVITAKQENFGGKSYTSARMTTQGKKSWTYGKIEASIAVPSFNGSWPAFWMLGDNIGSVGWPACGEIDIMEHVNTGNTTFGTIHWDNGGHQQFSNNTEVNNITTFHTHTVIWNAQTITWLVDGVQYAQANIANNINGTEEFHKSFFILLNFAIGGAWPGYNIDNGALPSNMLVDWVRVYQDIPGPASTTGLVTVYKDCSYSGFSGGLSVGDYTTAQLNALGVQNNDISSLKVAEGYKVIAYDGDNFTGSSITYTADNSCVGTWNDMISSVQVRANGATNVAGTYFVQNRNSGLFMDVAGGEAATQDGANIAQWSSTNTNNQKFEFIHLGDGTYTIKAVHSAKVVDVSGGPSATQDGVNVQQWTNFNSSNQQFIVVPVTGGYYKLIAKHSGKVVEVAGASTAVGGNIQQWTNNNQTCGQWTFNPVQLPYNAGNGIRADYFNGQNFDTWKTTKKENNVDFDWGNGSPDASVDADNFSARWTGKIQPRYSGTYTFYINSDNGRRLWVNGQLIIDKWLNDWNVEYTGTIALEAGKKYDIVFEYFEANGGASSHLEWSSPSQPREIVPQGQLYPNAAPTVTLTSPANNATYVAAATFAINATAADSDGSVAKVEFYNGTTKLGEDASSPYSFNWTNVAAGTYTITARAIDNQGVFTNSTAITVKVNANQNPTISITSPTNNATFTSPASITINATAADADGTVSKVEFYNGATKLGEDATSPYSFAWTNVAAGTYSLTAKAIDDKNGSATSTIITVVVSNPNQAPTVAITAPANNATSIAPGSFTITATASDADGIISKVEFYNGTTLLGTATASPYSYSWTNVAAGTYSITAKAYDNLGLATSSAAISVKVNANQAPAVAITAPANNATAIAPGSFTITATASDADGTISKVEFYNGTTLLGTSTTSPYSYSWINVAAGTYSITAKAYDNLGLATSSTAISVKVNANQAPTVAITAPANNTTAIAPSSFTITASASDVDGTISKVEFYNGTTLLGTSTTSPYSYSWTNVAAGTYSITAKAYDNLGLATSSTAISVKVNANQAPTVAITAPANNTTAIAPSSFTITASASDVDGSISKVEFYNGTTLLGTATSSPYNYNWPNVVAGTYSITAKAYDNLGLSTSSAAITVKVNANQSPVVTVSASSTSPNSVSISATATDPDGAIVKVEYYDGTTKIGESTVLPYGFTWTNVPAGSHSITAVAIDDKGGKTTSTPVIILVENPNQNPVVSITSPINNSTFGVPSSVTFTADASDADGSITKVEFYNGATKLGEKTSAPYTFNWNEINPGVYTIKVIAYDNKGAQAEDEISVELIGKSTSVMGQITESQLLVYPNPTKDILYLSPEIKEVNVYSLRGSYLMNVKLEGINNLDLSSLSSGVYLIELLGNRPNTFVKVTKE